MKYWLVVTSKANFNLDREKFGFRLQGAPYRFRKTFQKMKPGDKVVYYIIGMGKFGATATITGKYFNDEAKIWAEDGELWPSRCPSKPDIVLEDDELIDAKNLTGNLSFVKNKKIWGTYFQGSIREIPKDDFSLIEKELRMAKYKRTQLKHTKNELKKVQTSPLTEKEYQDAIMNLSLDSKSIHARITEMMDQIGSWMGYDTKQAYKISKNFNLDVAWLSGNNPGVAIVVIVHGKLKEPIDQLIYAKKVNYRKGVVVLTVNNAVKINKLMKSNPDMRNWMDLWSIGAVYKMYIAGKEFFKYFELIQDSIYKEKMELKVIE